jgi:hypothetical protein
LGGKEESRKSAPRTDEAIHAREGHDGPEGGHARPHRKLEEALL